jgi:cell division protein FtsW (lipid II flippase)
MKRVLLVAAIGIIHLVVAFSAGAPWWLIALIAVAFVAVEAFLISWRARRAARQA